LTWFIWEGVVALRCTVVVTIRTPIDVKVGKSIFSWAGVWKNTCSIVTVAIAILVSPLCGLEWECISAVAFIPGYIIA
jgi:hypothetical protein